MHHKGNRGTRIVTSGLKDNTFSPPMSADVTPMNTDEIFI
jgi:hypothetical protein